MKTKTLLAVGLLCPSFLLAGSWTNLDDAHYCAGQKLTEKDLANKVVAVFEWSTASEECVTLLPQIQKLWAGFKNKPFVFVASHRGSGSKEKIAEIAAAKKLTFPIYEGVTPAKDAPSGNIPFFYVVSHRGRVIHSGSSWQDATESFVMAIAEVGQPISLVNGVTLPKRFKSLRKKMRLGATITGDLKKLENEANTKKQDPKSKEKADEASLVLDAINQAKDNVKEEIESIKSSNPAEAVKLIKDFLKTFPKDEISNTYKTLLPELQKAAADAAKAMKAANG